MNGNEVAESTKEQRTVLAASHNRESHRDKSADPQTPISLSQLSIHNATKQNEEESKEEANKQARKEVELT